MDVTVSRYFPIPTTVKQVQNLEENDLKNMKICKTV
jgi:hypothetical protein